jgi:hypothetical protein
MKSTTTGTDRQSNSRLHYATREIARALEALNRGDIGEAEIRNIILEEELADVRGRAGELLAENQVLKQSFRSLLAKNGASDGN